MPTIYYSHYTPCSDSVSVINKQEHNLGRALLTQGVHELFHLPITCEEINSVLKYNANGKPYLPGHPEICFNITHCNQLVACAFHDSPIGIDAENPGYFPEVLINRALSDKEKCLLQSRSTSISDKQEWFYRFWTLKEAYVKKSGIGVDTDLTDFSFSFTDDGDNFSVICSDSSVSCYQTQLSHGQILSICYEDNGEPIKLVSCSQPHEPLR